jgi:hypothetical protein
MEGAMSQNSASERLPVAELKPLPRPVRILFPVVSSLSLWYLLVQGSALGYAQLQTLIEPAAAALPEEMLEERPARQVAALNRPVRPKAETLALAYASRLANVDRAVSSTVTPTTTLPPTPPRTEGFARLAPETPSSPPSSDAIDAIMRDAMLELLRELGLVSTASGSGLSPALSATELDRIVGGQGAPFGAGGVGQSGDEPDPQLDALNRVLVETGGLLLQPWTVELQPEIRYSYKGANGLLIVDQGGQRQVLAHNADLTRLEGALTVRVGLPWRSQAEVRVPYLHVSEESNFGNQSASSSEHGLGDIEVALSHQIFRENGWVPDLIGELRYRAPTGDDSFGNDATLPLGTGFHGIGGRLTAVKSVDPVVVVGSVGYTANLEDNKQGFDINPGNTLDLGIMAILAAGPGVSLRTGFGLSFTDEAKVDSEKISGSDKTEGVLNIGGAVVLPANILLDLGVGIGVTDDAPDVAARLALTYRF